MFPPDAAGITWTFAVTDSHMQALRALHAEAEKAAGHSQGAPLAGPTRNRLIAVAEKGGAVGGGIVAEVSIVVKPIGLDAEILNSADRVVIPYLVAFAQEQQLPFLNASLPVELVPLLGSAFERLGFKRVPEGECHFKKTTSLQEQPKESVSVAPVAQLTDQDGQEWRLDEWNHNGKPN
jgi:hypothetical protein